ncbi:apolipoprotein N-acyltransferase [Noviherbaspirillum sp.]|uniref:apolipoprotein N-acyltransferase n=1 Tax=Noviherbaspirillum sp. TaxID=1926288 RepID=UPI003FA533A4
MPPISSLLRTCRVTPRNHLASISRFAVPLAFVAGAANVFAFAPFGLWPLQTLLLALLFALVLRQASVRRSALIGWAYGSGWLIAGFHWLYISMHEYGNLPGWMAALAVMLLGVALSIYAAIAMGLAAWLRQRWSAGPAVSLLLLLPALWTLNEWARGWVLTGFPWVGGGYAHSAGPLAGFAPVVGVYGLALLSALIAGALVLAPHKRMAAILAGGILILGTGLRAVEWTHTSGAPISVRLLQGNVPQEMKFDPDRIYATLSMYHDMISTTPADLIATPETAIPMLSRLLPPDYLPRLSAFAQQSGSHLVLGVPLSDGPSLYANSAIGIAPATTGTSAGNATAPATYRYDKHHLVPFGEFVPTGFGWFVDMMKIPLGNFVRGKPIQPPFAVKGQWVLPNICYEDLFGEEIAAQIAASRSPGSAVPQATMLLNLSNIAWFGDSIALPQHLQISQMRSLETGRPMLRATNTGVTAVIDPKGRVQAQLAPYTRDALSATVQGYQGYTPYVLYGNKPAIALALLMLAAGYLVSRRQPGKSHEGDKTR